MKTWQRGLDHYAKLERDLWDHHQTITQLATGHGTALDLGVRGGVSSWALLDAGCEVYAVDIAPHQAPPPVTDSPAWHFVKGNTLDQELWKDLPAATVAFLDTSHEYPDTLLELRNIADHGVGLVILHDWNLQPVKQAVYEFIEESDFVIAGEEASTWGMAWLTS